MKQDKVVVQQRVVQTTGWSGPIPSPADIERLQKLIPNAGERLLSMAEEEARVRRDQFSKDHDSQNRVQENDVLCYHKRTVRGQFLGASIAILFLAGSVFCAYKGQTVIGVTLAGATVVGLVNALVNPRRR